MGRIFILKNNSNNNHNPCKNKKAPNEPKVGYMATDIGTPPYLKKKKAQIKA